jgi:hypothetical protein
MNREMKMNKFIVLAILALAVLCIGVGASVAAEKQEQVQQQTYVPKTIVDVPWGDAPEEVGLRKGPPETFGARTFTLDRKGNIYIYDHVKGFVKKFDKDGNFEGNIGPVTLGSSIAIGDNGHIFVIRGHAVDEYLKNGKLLKTHGISGDIGLIPGIWQGIKFDKKGNLYVNNMYALYEIGREVSGKFEALSHKEQKDSKKSGIPSNKKDKRLKTKVKDKHLAMLQMLDDKGNILKEMPMNTPGSFGGVQVNALDKYGYIYIEAEVFSDSGGHLEVRKYDEEGNLITTVKPEISFYTEPNKFIEVDEDGSIYVLSTSSDGVKIVKWSQQ